LPLFYDGLETLFDFLPQTTLVGVDHQTGEAADERLATILDAYAARSDAEHKTHYRALEPDALYLTREEWLGRLDSKPSRWFTPFASSEGERVIDMGARMGRTFAPERAQDSVNLFEATAKHAETLSAAGKRVLFASWSEGSSERLGHMLADHGLTGLPLSPYWQAAKP